MSVYSTPGVYNLAVPFGMTKMTSRCKGAAGGGFTMASAPYGGGGGGGGAAAITVDTPVMADVAVTVVVGQGGVAGEHGALSSVSIPNGAGCVCKAPGGSAASNGSGGGGAPASDCIGTTKHSGGNGAWSPAAYTGGGGGGGARDVADGSNGSAQNGGNWGGGYGGDAFNDSGVGLNAGTSAAAGGGGGGGGSSPNIRLGKPGGNGCVEITFS